MRINTTAEISKKTESMKTSPECQLFYLSQEGSLCFVNPEKQVLTIGDFVLVSNKGYALGQGFNRKTEGLPCSTSSSSIEPLGLFTLKKLLLLDGTPPTTADFISASKGPGHETRFFLAARLNRSILIIHIDGRFGSRNTPLLIQDSDNTWSLVREIGLEVLSGWQPNQLDAVVQFFGFERGTCDE